jgi:hypothetical protein
LRHADPIGSPYWPGVTKSGACAPAEKPGDELEAWEFDMLLLKNPLKKIRIRMLLPRLHGGPEALFVVFHTLLTVEEAWIAEPTWS